MIGGPEGLAHAADWLAADLLKPNELAAPLGQGAATGAGLSGQGDLGEWQVPHDF